MSSTHASDNIVPPQPHEQAGGDVDPSVNTEVILRRKNLWKKIGPLTLGSKDPFLIEYRIRGNQSHNSFHPVYNCFVILFNLVNKNRIPTKFNIEINVEKNLKRNKI